MAGDGRVVGGRATARGGGAGAGAGLRAGCLGLSAESGLLLFGSGQLLHRESREDRITGVDVGTALVHQGVAFLDQEPVIVAVAGGVHEGPHSLELVAAQLEEELAVLEPVGRTPRFGRDLDPDASVPADRRAGAVLTIGNDAFEVGVLERVRLDVHGQPLVGRIRRGPLRHRPRFEGAIHLQPQVPVQVAGGVHLHHEQPPPRRGAGAAERLRRAAGGALLAVLAEAVGGHGPGSGGPGVSCPRGRRAGRRGARPGARPARGRGPSRWRPR